MNIDTDELVKIIDVEIVNLTKRIKTGRIRDVDREKIRIKNLRTLGYLCKIHHELQESQKIDMIHNELEDIREIIAKNGDKQ